MTNFEKFKNALKKREEERFERLQKEIKEVKATVEKFLAMFIECTANQARTNYSGLEMY